VRRSRGGLRRDTPRAGPVGRGDGLLRAVPRALAGVATVPVALNGLGLVDGELGDGSVRPVPRTRSGNSTSGRAGQMARPIIYGERCGCGANSTCIIGRHRPTGSLKGPGKPSSCAQAHLSCLLRAIHTARNSTQQRPHCFHWRRSRWRRVADRECSGEQTLSKQDH
jgi:hypothetical protein